MKQANMRSLTALAVLGLASTVSQAGLSWQQGLEPAWAASTPPANTGLGTVPAERALVQAWAPEHMAAVGASRQIPSALAPLQLDASLEMSLWQFVTTVRSQQQGASFASLESNLRIVELASDEVSPVPLPGAAWLMLTGLLGLAGVHRKGRGRQVEPKVAPSGTFVSA